MGTSQIYSPDWIEKEISIEHFVCLGEENPISRMGTGFNPQVPQSHCGRLKIYTVSLDVPTSLPIVRLSPIVTSFTSNILLNRAKYPMKNSKTIGGRLLLDTAARIAVINVPGIIGVGVVEGQR